MLTVHEKGELKLCKVSLEGPWNRLSVWLSIISRSLLNARGKHRGRANVIPYERLNQTQHSCPLRGKGFLTKDGRKFLDGKKEIGASIFC